MAGADSVVGKGDATELMREIARYLDAVQTFRGEGRQPRWRAEPAWALNRVASPSR